MGISDKNTTYILSISGVGEAGISSQSTGMEMSSKQSIRHVRRC
jgi:hypothetical protein